MEGQLPVGHLPVLLQKGAAQHLLRGHPGAPRIFAPETHQVPLSTSQNLGIGIQHFGDRLQFLGDLISGHEAKDAPLPLSDLTQFFTSRILLSQGYHSITLEIIACADKKDNP